MRVLTVIGARPQFIKAAVVSRALAAHQADVREILVHTGQHYDANMSDVFFEELNIPRPEHNLGVGGGTHGQNTGRMLEKLEDLMVIEKPDWVLVYGDTDSTLAGALAAAKLHIPVAHVEAGLRSFNRRMPEEINRVLSDHLATLLFVPTELACTNLRYEGIAERRIQVVGDVMYDAALYYKSLARCPQQVDELGLRPGSYVLSTIHRAENTDDPERLRAIFSGLAMSNQLIVMPLHPRTRTKLAMIGCVPAANIQLIDPVGYLEMIWLEANCRLIVTDSGGVQKEAYFHGKPCLTLRDETEWVELLEAGVNKLVSLDPGIIADAINGTGAMTFRSRLYGDGDAAFRIAAILARGAAGIATA